MTTGLEPPAHPYLRRKEVALFVTRRWGIPLSANTLAKLAVTGGGPPFRKVGRFPVYEAADIVSWMESRIGPKQRSTSDTIPGSTFGR
jgi:hypothetical protein